MALDTNTIRVRIRELRQLFNSIDPSPFRERDLDPNCEQFIVSWARELPPERPVRVEIRIDSDLPPAQLLADIGPAVRSHFARAASLQELRRRQTLREGRRSLLIGLIALFACMGAATFLPTATLGPPGEIVRESFIIAGWVVMWHPLEVLLYGIWPVIREQRLLERLASADVSLTTPEAASTP